MDEFDNIIEKYKRELIEFSKSNSIPEEKCSTECGNENENKNTEPQKSETIIEKIQPKTNIEELAERTAKNNTSAQRTVEAAQTAKEPAVNNIEDVPYKAPQFDNYEDFLKGNPQNGLLRVQVFAAGQAFPVANARITVTLELKNGSRQMFDGLTDINGIADNIRLPAPPSEISQAPSESAVLPYSSYTTYVEHPDFVDAEFINVPVFAGIKSIQSVELIPSVNVGNQPQITELNEGESFIRLKGAD